MRNFRPLSTLSPQRFHTRGADKGIEVGKKPDLTYSRHRLSKSPFHCETPSKTTERDRCCPIARQKRCAGDRIQYGGAIYFGNWELAGLRIIPPRIWLMTCCGGMDDQESKGGLTDKVMWRRMPSLCRCGRHGTWTRGDMESHRHTSLGRVSEDSVP
jgi:hypothetical protein